MSWISLLGSIHAKGDGKGVLGAARKAFVFPPACAPLGPCRCNAKGFYGASSELGRETCCQLRSDPPLAWWHQDGLSIPRKEVAPTCSDFVRDGTPGKAALHHGEAGCGTSCQSPLLIAVPCVKHDTKAKIKQQPGAPPSPAPIT